MATDRAWKGSAATARLLRPRPAVVTGRGEGAGGAVAAGGSGSGRPWAALGGGLIVLVVAVAALVGPWLLGETAGRQNLADRLAPPLGFGGEGAHPLGTDALGRDLLARVVVGARVSLLVGVAATVAAGVIGVGLGVVAGSVRGPVERVVAWAIDVQQAIPFVVVAIALGAALGPGLEVVVTTLALTGWVAYARVVRLQTLALRRAPWVEAARGIGATPARLAVRHLLPNLAGPIGVLAGQQVAAMILAEAALSFLGLGAGGEAVSWGAMVADGQEAMLVAPWVAVVPGAAVAATVLGFALVGDGLAAPRVGRRRRPPDRRRVGGPPDGDSDGNRRSRGDRDRLALERIGHR